ncbi:hypothetical protein Vadar_010032 [Vaccinium darrowii]|uniref:Uncharacterized protein n=1 Tax=Vaccinium darrowii TaxID=229202 RepID=A0ACB7Z2Q2_9ERIC|nr:hypothetical protein Vadar_010032 [Vaccinium darrowii]
MANTTNILLSLLLATLLSSFLIHPTESTAVQRRSAKENSAEVTAEFIYSHNMVRESHDLNYFSWSPTLAGYARWWANQRRGDCAMIHSNSDYGENIFWGEGDGWTATDAVEAWAAESAYYNYQTNSCMPNRDCSHYTQLVWRSTTMVGCAKIKCDDENTFIVCEYAPHGNTIGQWPY